VVGSSYYDVEDLQPTGPGVGVVDEKYWTHGKL